MRRLMIPVLRLVAALLLGAAGGACISTSLNEEWSAPDFSWDTLKRDQILMTPLLDLRPNRKPDFYPTAKRLAYAEEFKQRFFKLRKDIRVFGAGGAFEYVAALPNLDTIGRAAFSRTSLPESELEILRSGNQEIRFLMVFGITEETLDYDVSYQFRKDQRDDVIYYYANRRLRIQMALWDAKENKTQWIGTKIASASNQNDATVYNPSKRRVKKKKDGKEYYEWEGTSLSISLASERSAHPSRFPEHPGRSGLLEPTFDDLALGFPIQPSEEKLLEYSYFTYHRPEAAAGLSALGKYLNGCFALGTSSILNNRYRLGGVMMFHASPTLRFHDEDFDVSGFGMALTADLEFAPTADVRLLVGSYLGFASYAIHRTKDLENRDPEAEVPPGESDSATMVWPRLRLLLGERQGFQVGPEIVYRRYFGIEAPLLLEERPAPFAIEVVAAYAVRGF